MLENGADILEFHHPTEDKGEKMSEALRYFVADLGGWIGESGMNMI